MLSGPGDQPMRALAHTRKEGWSDWKFKQPQRGNKVFACQGRKQLEDGKSN